MNRHIHKFESYINLIKEGRSNYWPGYSSDATWDTIHSMKEDISEQYLDEKLDELYEHYSKPSDENIKDIYDQTDEESIWWNKEQYANIVTTLLQDGFIIPKKHLEQALENYKEVMNDPKWKEYVEWKDSQNAFGKTIPVIIHELEKVLKQVDDTAYKPGFLDDEQDVRQIAEFEIGEGLYHINIDSNKLNDIVLSKFSEEEIKNMIKEAEKVFRKNKEQGYLTDVPYNLDDVMKNLDKYSKDELIQILAILLG